VEDFRVTTTGALPLLHGDAIPMLMLAGLAIRPMVYDAIIALASFLMVALLP